MSRHLPPNIPIDKVENIYLDELNKISDTLIGKINIFIKTVPQESVESAEFQVFPDEDCEGESSIWMYFDGKNKKIDRNDESLFAGKSVEFFTEFASLPTLDLDQYEELDYADMLVDLIVRWFAECWWKAGGWYYPVHVEILGHDGFGSVDKIELTEI